MKSTAEYPYMLSMIAGNSSYLLVRGRYTSFVTVRVRLYTVRPFCLNRSKSLILLLTSIPKHSRTTTHPSSYFLSTRDAPTLSLVHSYLVLGNPFFVLGKGCY